MSATPGIKDYPADKEGQRWGTLLLDIPKTGLRHGDMGYVISWQAGGVGASYGTDLAPNAFLLRFERDGRMDGAECWVTPNEVRPSTPAEVAAARKRMKDRRRDLAARRKAAAPGKN